MHIRSFFSPFSLSLLCYPLSSFTPSLPSPLKSFPNRSNTHGSHYYLFSFAEAEEDLKREEERCTRIQTEEKLFKCLKCKKKFTRCDLKTHNRTHSDQYNSGDSKKPFKCQICEKKFTTSSNLDKHTRIHTGEKPFKCLICEKQFNQSSSLKTHTRIHTGEKPFKCERCHKTFPRSHHLEKHVKTHLPIA